MTLARDEIIQKVWRGVDPFRGFQAQLYRPQFGGWGCDHQYLSQSVQALRPRIVVEIGVWNGQSSKTLADAMRAENMDGVVISVDTWLGSAEHWVNIHFQDLNIVDGYPTKQRTFMANVAEWGLMDLIAPLPLDSVNAAHVLAHYAIVPDLIHLDAAHDYESVVADLRTWWPILRKGGHLIGDDYHVDGIHWPGVRRAFDELCLREGVETFEYTEGKCRVVKP